MAGLNPAMTEKGMTNEAALALPAFDHIFTALGHMLEIKNITPQTVGPEEYAKKRVKELKLNGEGKVRINKAGCLDRCEEGPAVVVYPEGTWYTYVDASDIDEIVESHLANGKVVERLKIDR